ncbi:tripartite tricarboxylate transporter substrate binding protein [Xenophilus arseniciresistens]|uniref:Tripartite tricarboxylate transporter substrate binding protein n=1 Tax=Xenophilus arseniciresistens TaxID=1283306 RepID=A0AAE3T1G1_9BURK|nr:tripartite tricarboxylate transporter substrate binding protein [Xenophilus arseniciresistens]MDA7417337.1 tripartite tricarboxylate transporter substrate binding protein [Xenophilus arseniciresistens]
MLRKTFIALSLGIVSLPLLAQAPAGVNAEAFKQLSDDKFTIISPFPPGGPVDTLARVMADGLSRRYGQPAVVENVPGAAAKIGMDKVKRAKADGHTLLLIPAGNLTINPTLMPNFTFNVEKDFEAVTMLAKAPNLLVAAPSSGIKSAKELVALAKAKPGTLSYASPGIGSGLHLAGELFKQHTGTDLLHVAYKGTGPAMNDVLGGTVPLMFTNLPAALPHLASGKLVALGITEAQRTSVAPNIPTLAEQGIKGVNVTSWYGMMAPAGTPAVVVQQLARDAAEFLSQPDVKQRLAAQGMTQNTMAPAAFAKYIKDETATWAGVIQDRQIKAE